MSSPAARAAARAHDNQRRMQRAQAAAYDDAALLAATAGTLAVWLAARKEPSPPADGTLMTTLADQSGNARAATGAADATRPAFKTGIFNGLPAYRFSGAQVRQTPAFASTSYAHVVVFSGSGTAGVLVAHNSGGAETQWVYTSNGGPSVYGRKNSVNEGWDLPAGWGTDGVLHIVADHYADGTHAGHTARLDSLNAATLTGGFAADPGVGSSGAIALTIGQSGLGTLSVTADIAEVLAFHTAPSLAVLRDVIAYLATVYGKTLT